MRDLLDAALDAYDFEALAHCDVTLAVPDATRAVDLEAMLGPWLQRVPQSARVRALVALGLHRPMTPAERAPLVRLEASHGLAWRQHDARGPQVVWVHEDVGLDEQGRWPLPASFHRDVVEAHRVVCVGSVEPHQYAGFSGGIKTVGIGCAGADTISAMHGLTYLRDPGTQLGRLEGNPFQDALWRTTSALDATLDVFQLVPRPSSKDTLAMGLGPARATFKHLTEVARGAHFKPILHQVPWAHVPVRGAKATNFYQASRAATYVSLAQDSAVARGGWIVLDALCPEGMGKGEGERGCEAKMMLGQGALAHALHHAPDPRLKGGEQRAFVIARALQTHRIALVGSPPMAALAAMGIPQFATLEDAVVALNLDAAQGARFDDAIHSVPSLSVAQG